MKSSQPQRRSPHRGGHSDSVDASHASWCRRLAKQFGYTLFRSFRQLENAGLWMRTQDNTIHFQHCPADAQRGKSASGLLAWETFHPAKKSSLFAFHSSTPPLCCPTCSMPLKAARMLWVHDLVQFFFFILSSPSATGDTLPLGTAQQSVHAQWPAVRADVHLRTADKTALLHTRVGL